MKVRVTLMTENKSPAESAGKTKEERNRNAEAAWHMILAILRNTILDADDRIELESAEVLDDEENK